MAKNTNMMTDFGKPQSAPKSRSNKPGFPWWKGTILVAGLSTSLFGWAVLIRSDLAASAVAQVAPTPLPTPRVIVVQVTVPVPSMPIAVATPQPVNVPANAVNSAQQAAQAISQTVELPSMPSRPVFQQPVAAAVNAPAQQDAAPPPMPQQPVFQQPVIQAVAQNPVTRTCHS